MGDNWYWLVMIGDGWGWSVKGRVQTDFGFSFDTTPTIDTVMYFRGLNRGRWSR